MEKFGLSQNNLNKTLALGVILLILFVAFRIYLFGNQQVNSLNLQRNKELKKSEVIQDIAALEKKMEVYKKVLIKKDVASIMAIISGIAKNCSVEIFSIKPDDEVAHQDYFESPFSITLRTPNYHSLGNFISQIENHKDIYLVSEVNITPARNEEKLNVNLKIKTISYK